MEPADFLALCAANPTAAADHVEQAAEVLRQFAGDLRNPDGRRAISGMTDRVRANVISETGQIKQSIDTQEQP